MSSCKQLHWRKPSRGSLTTKTLPKERQERGLRVPVPWISERDKQWLLITLEELLLSHLRTAPADQR